MDLSDLIDRNAAFAPAKPAIHFAGTTLTYALFGLVAFLRGHTNLGVPTDRIDIAGQIVLAAAVLLLIWWGRRRSGLVAPV